jgi:hypothetical protein
MAAGGRDGIAAITKSVAGFMNAVTNFRTGAPKIHQIEGEDAILAEFSADADVAPVPDAAANSTA